MEAASHLSALAGGHNTEFGNVDFIATGGESAARNALENLQNQRIGNRYIELFPSKGPDAVEPPPAVGGGFGPGCAACRLFLVLLKLRVQKKHRPETPKRRIHKQSNLNSFRFRIAPEATRNKKHYILVGFPLCDLAHA